MNKNKLEKILSPLIVLPLSYIGAVLINESQPPADELLWMILFIAFVSLPVGYLGLFFIVIPVERALKKINRLSVINLIILCSISGGILFSALNYTSIPGHDRQWLLGMLIVFPMGFILGLSVTLCYCAI
jgi:hypothetical protein